MDVASLAQGLQDFSESWILSRWVFLRALAVVYACAFLSVLVQIRGLIGEQGILPLSEFLNTMRSHYGRRARRLCPTVFWWFPSDRALLMVSGGGLVASACLFLGFLELPSLIFLFVAYLSLTVAAQDFFSFQWDVLLIETGFIAIFLAPLQIWTGTQPALDVSPFAIFLIWWLIFRLMFESGAVKLSCGDETWRRLRSLDVHYQTQPLPNRISWYAHQLPRYFHRIGVLLVLFIEILLPFFIFAPAHGRHAVAVAFLFLMLIIFLTGNYTFFNILAAALCLFLFDDSVWRRILPTELVNGVDASLINRTDAGTIPWAWWIHAVLLFGIIMVSGPQVIQAAFPHTEAPAWIRRWQRALQSFRIVNSYGLFRHMTLTRPEIVIEGSMDGREWIAYEFHSKPGELGAPPRCVAPHQPRLDWQMWFAALSSFYRTIWLQRLVLRLFEGSEPVLRLLKSQPFREPPRYIRALLYDYEFTSSHEKKSSGHWWKRKALGLYAPPMKRPGATDKDSLE